MNQAYRRLTMAGLLAAATLLAGCERPPIEAVQHGYRGTAMAQIYNPRTVAAQAPLNAVPESPAPASPDGPKAGQIYQNVKVLGDLSVGEFARHMISITAWVSPKEGCTYCHVGENFADDGKYTKVVARRMLEMTQQINANWKNHVAQTGVTCYTCHRGNPVPANVWFTEPPQAKASTFLGNRAGQNIAAPSVGLASLPGDPFTPFLLGAEPIRVNGPTALPTGNRMSTKQTEWTYSLMEHMSTSLGVNCTYCHNTRAFQSWDDAPPQRVTAWYGIRMARELNNDYLLPLTASFPANRLGPTGDVAKIGCGTCHQGAYKPLNGVSMLAGHPELAAPRQAAPVPAAPAASATAAAPGPVVAAIR
jgi:photosynthetic reaction center cytochrome c subunit